MQRESPKSWTDFLGRDTKTSLVPVVCILPALVFLFFFWGYPTLYALILSFTNASLGHDTARFVGLDNYLRLMKDPIFWVSLRNTGILLVGSVVFEVFLGLVVALFLYRSGKGGKGLLTAVLVVPWLFSELVSALTWRWIFEEPFGLLNAVLHQLGLPTVAWLSRTGTALGALLVASLWQGIGISTLVIAAALRGIPGKLMDLASLDGAVGWKGLRHVVLPQIRGVLMLDGLLVGIKSLGAFTMVFALTGGGPGYGTEVLATYVYRVSFFHYEMGYASAVGASLAFLFLLLISLVFFRQKGLAGAYQVSRGEGA